MKKNEKIKMKKKVKKNEKIYYKNKRNLHVGG